MSHIRVSIQFLLLVLLLALVPASPLSGPPARNSGEAKKVEVSFSVNVSVSARAKLEETSRGAGPDALPGTRRAADRFTMTIRGERRWTIDADQADSIIGGLMMEPGDFRVSAEGSGTFTGRGEEIGIVSGKRCKSQTGEDHQWTHRLAPETLVPLDAGTLQGLVSIRHETGTPGEGQFSVSFPLYSHWHTIETKGTAASWSKGCGDSISESEKIESARFAGSIDAPTLSRDAALEAGEDERFQGELSGTFQTKDKRFNVTRHFSYRHGPERIPFDDTAAAGPEDPWTKSLEQKDATVDVTYTLTYGGSPDVEAVIIPPDDYDSWLPQAAANETAIGGIIDVQVALQKKDKPGERTNRTIKSLTVELLEVSREKGVCLNWPPKDKARDTLDLKIDPRQHDMKVAADGQSAKSTKEGQDSFTFIVNSYDWGASGKLRATVTLDDGEQLVARVQGQRRETLTIPKDENDNGIADGWEKTNGVEGGDANADDEDSPEGDGHPGDGLALYDEYRGFMENGTHIFGDPKKKDLFICNKIGALADLGIGIFENISGLAVHSKLKPGGRSGPGELDTSRIININRSKTASLHDQHGVFIEKGDEGLASEAVPLSGFEPTPGPPKKFEKVKIGLGFLAASYSAYGRASVVAHEILHCCGVWHHGQTDLQTRKFQTKADAAGVKRLFIFEVDSDGNAVETGTPIILYKETGGVVDPEGPKALAGFNLWIGMKQGQHSGDTDCVMRYHVAHVYITTAGRYVGYADKEVYGLGICANGLGTGVNEPGRAPEPRYGDATDRKGDCRKQICVNDMYH